MPTMSAVCGESNALPSCFHTGTAFCPEARSSSFSLRTLAIASVSMGRLLLMARMNICGLSASDGSSCATCVNCNFRLAAVLPALSMPAVALSSTTSVSCPAFFCFSSSASSSFSPFTMPVMACMSAICFGDTTPCSAASFAFACISASSFSSSAMTDRVFCFTPSMFFATERSPARVRSFMNISSLIGSIYFYLAA